MRKALNDNPMVQLVVIAVLALAGGYFLLQQFTKGGSSQPAAPSATDVPVASGAPVTTSPQTGQQATTAAAPSAAGQALQAIPVALSRVRMPKPVTVAYQRNNVVVLLVVRNGGIDDGLVQSSVESLRGTPGVSVFVTHSRDIAKYASITAGVGVDRAPALVVLRPRKLSHGSPQATVEYGFRSAASVKQAVRNARYNGPQLSYDPG